MVACHPPPPPWNSRKLGRDLWRGHQAGPSALRQRSRPCRLSRGGCRISSWAIREGVQLFRKNGVWTVNPSKAGEARRFHAAKQSVGGAGVVTIKCQRGFTPHRETDHAETRRRGDGKANLRVSA